MNLGVLEDLGLALWIRDRQNAQGGLPGKDVKLFQKSIPTWPELVIQSRIGL